MKSSVFSLVITVFLFWLTIQINSAYEEMLSYTFILTIGVIHGSNDISLIKIVKNQRSFSHKYLFFYICLVCLNIVSFLFFPHLALVFFIVISCYHFGEQHLYTKIKCCNMASKLWFYSYGHLIFGLLFYFNSEQTATIIYELTSYRLNAIQFSWFLGIGIILVLLFMIFNLKNLNKSFHYFQELFLILLFAMLFKLAALLWGFAIYFIIWHSLPSLKDQITTLYGVLSKRNVYEYIKSSFLYWLISMSGIGLLYYTTSYFEVKFVTVFFAFLAAITVPHVIVMYVLNKN